MCVCASNLFATDLFGLYLLVVALLAATVALATQFLFLVANEGVNVGHALCLSNPSKSASHGFNVSTELI